MVKVKRRVGGSPSLVSWWLLAIGQEKQTSKPHKRVLSADLVTSTINIPLKETIVHASPPTCHSLIYRFMSLPRDMLSLRAIMFCVLPCSRHLKDWWLCVQMNLNSSLSHTKHPRCLCINNAVRQGCHNTRNYTMCHLIRLGSQSKCSHAHLNGCLLLCNHLSPLPPFATHKHTHRTLPLFHQLCSPTFLDWEQLFCSQNPQVSSHWVCAVKRAWLLVLEVNLVP